MSSTERQRKFRAAHPGYFNKYNNRRKAGRIAAQKKVLELLKELAKVNAAALQQQQQQPAPPVVMSKPALMLPAPVEDPMTAEVNALAASLKARSALQPLPVAKRAA